MEKKPFSLPAKITCWRNRYVTFCVQCTLEVVRFVLSRDQHLLVIYPA